MEVSTLNNKISLWDFCPPGESRALSDLAIQADGLMGATCFSTPHMNKIPRMRVSLWDGDGGRERERERERKDDKPNPNDTGRHWSWPQLVSTISRLS